MKIVKKQKLTREYILSKISEEEIFKKILGDFKIGEIFCNPLRSENTASTIIRSINNKLVLKDYGSSVYRGDCFDLIQFVNGCNYDEALKMVEKDFNLINKNVLSISREYVKKVIPKFQVITRAPTNEELKYWEQYYITLSDLKKDNIYFPKEIWRNKKKIGISIMTFCYFYPELNAFKLYRPQGKLGKDVWYSERKFDSGIPNNYLENKSSIQNCDKSFLCTSKKDRLVATKVLELDCISNVQAENLDAIKDEDMEYIKANSKEQYIIGDRDLAGKSYSWLLTKEFGFKHVNPPDDKPKDIADWVKECGIEEVRNHFKQKKILI